MVSKDGVHLKQDARNVLSSFLLRRMEEGEGEELEDQDSYSARFCLLSTQS